MNLTLRRAQPDDARAIATIHVRSWRSTYAGIVPASYLASLQIEQREQMWAPHLSAADGPLIFVSEDAEGIFGFVSGGAVLHPAGELDAELHAIYLLERGQKRGAGHSLTCTLASGLIALGHKSLLVWVLEANPAVNFYRRLGASLMAQADVSIGGAALPELALGWPDIRSLRPPA